jgi:hypothetical protein
MVLERRSSRDSKHVAGLFFSFLLLSTQLLGGCGLFTAATVINPADTGGSAYSRSVSIVKTLDRYSSANYATNFLWWDSTGKTVELRDSFGNVRVLLFWNTKCGACVDAAFTLESLRKEFIDSPVVMVGVTLKEELTPREAVPEVQRVVDSLSIQYQQIVGQQEMSYAYEGVDVLPTVLFVSREGLNLKRLSGKLDQPQLRRELLTALKFSPPK